MFGKSFRRIIIAPICLLSVGISDTVWGQQSVSTTGSQPSQVVVQVGDYVITVHDLERLLSTYPEGSVSSREEKRRVVESLISTKLFALGARSAKLDQAEDFPKASEKQRQGVLIYAYFLRYVRPKFTEEEAQKYFEQHKEKFGNFTFYRSHIMGLLKEKTLAETNQSLMQQFRVEQRDDLLKDLDVRNAKDPTVVVARVGDAVVTVGDMKEFASQHPKDFSTLKAKQEMLDVLILERLYVLAAIKAGLANDPDVQKEMMWAEEQLLAMRYVDTVRQKVSHEEARRYYQTHPEEFKQPDQFRLRQILVATPDQAQAVKTRLDRGEAFEEVARAVSIDPASAVNGGDIGWVRSGRLYPEVEKVAFQLKPKQVSEPIKAPNGYYIMRLEERSEGTVRPFAQVVSNLLVRLKTQAVEAERKHLMSVYNVTINDQLL